MKVMGENSIYVQKKDIIEMSGMVDTIPASIFMKMYGEGVVIIQGEQVYEFIEFDDQAEIDFFNKLDWILNYNDVKNLTDEELAAFGQKIVVKRISLIDKYNKMSKEEKLNSDIPYQCETLEHKASDVVQLLQFRKGVLKINFPKELGIEVPKQENGFQKIFGKIFNRENK